LLGVNFALLGISIYLGLKSANQMKEIVKEDFNQQQWCWPNIPPAC